MENKSSKAFSKNGTGGSCIVDDKKKKKRDQNGVGSTSVIRCCQAEKCTSDLSEAKQYLQRHRVCEFHAKAQAVVVAGIHQRFCQLCSRFHELSEFDEAKRSCRRRLAGRNERRRKNLVESKKEQEKQLVSVQNDDNRRRFEMAIQDKANYNHLFE